MTSQQIITEDDPSQSKLFVRPFKTLTQLQEEYKGNKTIRENLKILWEHACNEIEITTGLRESIKDSLVALHPCENEKGEPHDKSSGQNSNNDLSNTSNSLPVVNSTVENDDQKQLNQIGKDDAMEFEYASVDNNTPLENECKSNVPLTQEPISSTANSLITPQHNGTWDTSSIEEKQGKDEKQSKDGEQEMVENIPLNERYVFQMVRGDGNCMYRAFGFAFLREIAQYPQFWRFFIFALFFFYR